MPVHGEEVRLVDPGDGGCVLRGGWHRGAGEHSHPAPDDHSPVLQLPRQLLPSANSERGVVWQVEGFES